MIQDDKVRKHADEQIDCVQDSKKQTKLDFLNKDNQESSHGLSEIEIVDFKGKSFAAYQTELSSNRLCCPANLDKLPFKL